MTSEASRFPTRRLRDAGASTAEIEELNAKFARSDEVYQSQFVNSFLGKSKVEVRVWLEDARSDGFISPEATGAPSDDRDAPKSTPRGKREPVVNASVSIGDEDDESGA